MRALRTSKTWLLLTLHALLILVGAPAFASQCCCASETVVASTQKVATTQKTNAPCHDDATPAKATNVQSIVMTCCAPEVADKGQTSSAPSAENYQFNSLQSRHLTQICSCSSSETVAVASDDLLGAHHISHLVAVLPAISASRFQTASFTFSVATFATPPAPITLRAAGRSPPLV